MAKVNRTVLDSSVPTITEFSTGGVVRTKFDLFQYNNELWEWNGDVPHVVPSNSSPNTAGGTGAGLWVNLGSSELKDELVNGDGSLIGIKYPDSDVAFTLHGFATLTVLADAFIDKVGSVTAGLHSACDYVRAHGGGSVVLSSKTYLLEDEFIPRNNVKVYGNSGGYWSSPTTLKWAGTDGTGKCVVRASSGAVGTLTSTALSGTGLIDCHIDADGCDVGLYSQYVTGRSEFSGLVVKKATVVNTYILKSWFCDYHDISSIQGKGKGTVIGQPLFGESGQMNVNACGFTSLKAHSNGSAVPAGSDVVTDGVGLVLGKYMNSNFIPSIQSEANVGIGVLAYSTFTNSIGAMYIEANAYNMADSIKNCGFMFEHGGSNSALSIASLHLANTQYIINNVDLGLIVQSIGRNDNINSFQGTGRVLSVGNNLRAFSSTEWSKLASDNVILVAGKNLNTQYNSSFDSMSFVLAENIGYPHIVVVPRANYTLSNDLVLRLESHTTGTNFGKNFTARVPIVRRISNATKGFQYLRMPSPTGNTAAHFDVYVMYARERMGGQILPRLYL